MAVEDRKRPRVKNKEIDVRISVWESYALEAAANFDDSIIPTNLIDPLMTWAYLRDQRKRGQLDTEKLTKQESKFKEKWGDELEKNVKFRKAIFQITEKTQVLTGVGYISSLK
jgi:hypothetical protein